LEQQPEQLPHDESEQQQPAEQEQQQRVSMCPSVPPLTAKMTPVLREQGLVPEGELQVPLLPLSGQREQGLGSGR